MTHMLRLLLCCALLLPCAARADQNDPELKDLFALLRKAPDEAAALTLEAEIWEHWFTHKDPAIQTLLDTGSAQMAREDFQSALTTFTRLIQQAPEYAEGWNRRATLHYLMGNYPASEKDIQQTLKLEPYHFGALSGRGLVKLALRDLKGARAAFLSALEVNPMMGGVRGNIAMIDAQLAGSDSKR